MVVLFSPLDLTKVRLQATDDKRMISSIKKTIATGGMFLFVRVQSLRRPCDVYYVEATEPSVQAFEACLTAYPVPGCAN